MNIIKEYAQFRGRVKRGPFWFFIAATHTLLIILFTPTLFLLLNFGVQLMGEPQFGRILEKVKDTCVEQGCIDLNQGSKLSATELEACVQACTPIITDELLPLIIEQSDSFIKSSKKESPWAYTCTLLGIICTLLLIIPSNAITVRRLRDAGMSPYLLLLFYVGFFPLLSSIAFIAQLALFVLLCLPSKPIPPTLPE